MKMPQRSAAARLARSRAASIGRDPSSRHCFMSTALKISAPMKPCAPSSVATARTSRRQTRSRVCATAGSDDHLMLTNGLERRRDLLGAVTLRHVDDRLHRSGQLVHITDIGEVTLRGTSQRLGRYAIEQDETEVTVGPPGRRAGIEF